MVLKLLILSLLVPLTNAWLVPLIEAGIKSPEFLSELGNTPAAVLVSLILASLIRSWRHRGKARVYAVSAAMIFAGLLIQLYFAPFGYVATVVLLIFGLASWTASLALTKGWYLLLEIVLMPVINIAMILVFG